MAGDADDEGILDDEMDDVDIVDDLLEGQEPCLLDGHEPCLRKTKHGANHGPKKYAALSHGMNVETPIEKGSSSLPRYRKQTSTSQP